MMSALLPRGGGRSKAALLRPASAWRRRQAFGQIEFEPLDSHSREDHDLAWIAKHGLWRKARARTWKFENRRHPKNPGRSKQAFNPARHLGETLVNKGLSGGGVAKYVSTVAG